ncbi:unnamed protein product [Toxocara canis]|uniref:Uncharacterized protein n=1 Tax=Toxocara canis TaxID=6265 RepID=A0A183UW12_TOXCA|nr:unnamed protein product [Toxocara canis]
MGKLSRSKKLDKMPKQLDQGGFKSSSTNDALQDDSQEKSAFEVLKMDKKEDESLVNSALTSVGTPLASKKRRKRRGNDGIGAKRAFIRSTSEILAEKRAKVRVLIPSI